VINSFRPLDPAEVVLGQYDGYRSTPGIAADSSTDTFVAAQVWIVTDRWRDVPFLMRTGKRLARDGQRVSLLLREPTGPLASLPNHGNVLSFSMYGSGAIDLTLVAKRPGPTLTLDVADANIALSKLPDPQPLPPYVRLIHDVLIGDRSLFTRPDGLAAVWQVAEPLLRRRPDPQPYTPGSWGPAAAADLAAPDGWLLGQ
jgi:glucose-6-phosphate 1-dehydrogenase